ncbi:MAG: HEAT repeat domain-containing protein [Coriobacteriia bacterium]|nr:HEAT repeat domain-containing protein [Coriobacteriia bacterium]
MGLLRRDTPLKKIEKLKKRHNVRELRTYLTSHSTIDEELREAAALALATMDDAAAMTALASAVRQQNRNPGRDAGLKALPAARGPAVGEWAVNALRNPSQHGFGFDFPDDWVWSLALECAPERFIDMVEASLNEEPEREMRRMYVQRLTSLDGDRITEVLRAAARHKRADIREYALEGLAARGDAEAAEALSELRRAAKEARAAEAVRRAAEVRTSAAARICAACGRKVLTTEEFVAAAREVGFVVDPITGDATFTASGVVSGVGGLLDAEREGQRRYDEIEATRGYVCGACGRPHCTACLMKAPQHPETRGPRCPSCREGPHAILSS